MENLRKRHPDLPGKKILVADDVEMNQMLARHLMESWGFSVTVAENGKMVLQKLLNDQYDLILMDIQMPEMDGVEATKQIRKLDDKVKASIPIVALTANMLAGDSEKYLAAGMNDYIAKPIDEKKLFDILSRNLCIMNEAGSVDEVTPQSEKLYDLALVEAISGGDEGFVRNMLSLFLETVPATLEQMQTACDSADWELTGKLAHKLKSTIDSMNIAQLKNVIRKIESDGKKRENLNDIPLNVQCVRTVMQQCIEAVKKDFKLG